MEMNEYQKLSMKTDRMPHKEGFKFDSEAMWVPLLGLSGEVGELLVEYKKYLRDGQGHQLFEERIVEELGDILWYLTNVATKFNLNLADVAHENLGKVYARHETVSDSQVASSVYCFDKGFPDNERFPRNFVVNISDDGNGMVDLFCDGVRLGNRISDNNYVDDGYRFHDVLHLSNAAVLGWSPITRWMLKRKRRSDERTNKIEDGRQAISIEEGISAIVFSYAERNNFLTNDSWVSTELLRTVKKMTSTLEVSRCNEGDWEMAIRTGFDVWRTVKDAGYATLMIDLDRRTVFCV